MAPTTAVTNGTGIIVDGLPTITSATYDAATGELVVTGANFKTLSGDDNDIVAEKFTFTGEGGETHTLANTPNVEILSSTEFTLTLSATDRKAVNTRSEE